MYLFLTALFGQAKAVWQDPQVHKESQVPQVLLAQTALLVLMVHKVQLAHKAQQDPQVLLELISFWFTLRILPH
jgi:hypothetical protein